MRVFYDTEEKRRQSPDMCKRVSFKKEFWKCDIFDKYRPCCDNEGRTVCIGYGVITRYRSKGPRCVGNGRVV